MKKTNLLLLVILVLLAVLIGQVALQVFGGPTNRARMAPNPVRTSTTTIATTTGEIQRSIDQQARNLVEAYPDVLMIDPHDSNVIIWKKDGTRMQFDDGISGKDLETMLTHPDLQDQMSMRYVSGESYTITKDYDPGRVRYEPFFKKMYGATEAQVKANLVTIYWLPHVSNQPLLVTRINGVNQKLQAVSDELDRLVQQPGGRYLLAYLKDPGGTFKWRNVAGEDALSPHSYGIAIDINTTRADYWRWSSDGGIAYHNQIPMEIVKVFEKYGFIWGGKWYHYDTMHFEYRPELLMNQLQMD